MVPGFEAVRDAFDEVLTAQGGGAACAAIVDGTVVCDLWGGTVGAGSLVHTWSVIKPVSALCLLLAARRSDVALDTPIAELWPELRAARDQPAMTVAALLAHRGGLVSVPARRRRRPLRPAIYRGGAGRGRTRLAAGLRRRRAHAHIRPPGRRRAPPHRRTQPRDVPPRRGGRAIRSRCPHRAQRRRGGAHRRPRFRAGLVGSDAGRSPARWPWLRSVAASAQSSSTDRDGGGRRWRPSTGTPQREEWRASGGWRSTVNCPASC